MESYELPLDLMSRRYRMLIDCKQKGGFMKFVDVIKKIQGTYIHDDDVPFDKRPCPGMKEKEILPFRFLSKKNDVWYVPPYTIKSDNMIRFYPEKTQGELEYWATPYETFVEDVVKASITAGLTHGGRTRRRK